LKYLVFEPSPDHDTQVTRYVLRLAPAGSPQAPVVESDLGKPAVTNGECRVDIGSLLNLLPAGSYVALVSADSAAGLSAPGVSAVFTW
jgi:hypothetical protein